MTNTPDAAERGEPPDDDPGLVPEAEVVALLKTPLGQRVWNDAYDMGLIDGHAEQAA